MAVSEFRSRVSQVVGHVARTKESVVLTKRGKPFAAILPIRSADIAPVPGKLVQTLVFEKDIISPIGDSGWKACDVSRNETKMKVYS